jgi:hypothetical protein
MPSPYSRGTMRNGFRFLEMENSFYLFLSYCPTVNVSLSKERGTLINGTPLTVIVNVSRF